MAQTDIIFGGLELGESAFNLPLIRGWDYHETRIRQLADRYDEIKNLPYANDLVVTCTSETGTTKGAGETVTFKGLRLLDVYLVDEQQCEFIVTTAMKDLHDRVCPADANIRWKDGWLNNTRFQYMLELFEYMAPLIAALEDVLADDAFDALEQSDDFELPVGEPLAGLMLPDAGSRVTDLLGVDPVIGADGKLRFERRGIDTSLPVDAYNWLLSAEPTWRHRARTPRGLPGRFDVHYVERHALRWRRYGERETVATDIPSELRAELVNVFFYEGNYGTLQEMLRHFGYDRDAITDAQVGTHIMSVNFEGTAIEAGLSANAETVIGILKRDWRQLWKIEYSDDDGRRGGWDNPIFGFFETRENKDGDTAYTGDVSDGGIRMEYTEYLAKVDEERDEQGTLIDGVVFRSHLKKDGVLPIAPFVAQWEADQVGEIFRIAPKPDPNSQQAVYPGRMTNNSDYVLSVRKRDFVVKDDGELEGTPGKREYVYIPTPSDLKFAQGPSEADGEFEIEANIVATRRQPNDASRWTTLERDGFPDADVDVFEPEVGEEIHALRDFVAPEQNKFAEPDGFGAILNEDELERDADRRVRALKDRMGTLVDGSGVAIGVAPIADLRGPKEAIRRMTLMVDGVSVLTQVEVGKLDSEKARQQRHDIRRQLRKRHLGGKELA